MKNIRQQKYLLIKKQLKVFNNQHKIGSIVRVRLRDRTVIQAVVIDTAFVVGKYIAVSLRTANDVYITCGSKLVLPPDEANDGANL
jgi:hypothetical protein